MIGKSCFDVQVQAEDFELEVSQTIRMGKPCEAMKVLSSRIV